jgi:hypothetical protein
MKLPFEDALFWWLYRRFLKRCDTEMLRRMRYWLKLDISLRELRKRERNNDIG